MTYVNESSVLAVGILFLLLGTSAVVARFFLRLRTLCLGMDDWFCLLAWLFVTADCIIMIIGSATHTVGSHSPPGLGPKILSYDGEDQLLLERLEYPFDMIQIFALAALKLSILFLYRRLFVGRAFNIASWALIGLVVTWAVAFCVCLLAQCGSNIVANFQTLGDLKEKCIDTFAILIALAASDVAVDLVILAIPVPLVLSLHLPLKKRIGILAILLVGTLATGCGVARMSLFIEILGPSLFSKETVGGVASDDDIGIVSILMFWGMLEIGVGMVAICLPVLCRLLRDWSPRSLFDRLRSFMTRTKGDSHHDIEIRSFGAGQKGLGLNESGTTRVPVLPKIKALGWNNFGDTKQGYVAYCGRKTSGDTVSQKRSLGDGEIWEQTEITQTSEVV